MTVGPTATELRERALAALIEPDGHLPWCDEEGCHPDCPRRSDDNAKRSGNAS